MVLGYHLILGAYGFWLPNDPRGSGSSYVGSKALIPFGAATKVDTRRSVAARPHDVDRRQQAKRAMKYPVVRFTGVQARAIGRGFHECVRKSELTIWACCILPEHGHLVVARHRQEVEQIANLLKGEATKRVNREAIHPLAAFAPAGGRPPTMWGRDHWKVFLNTPEDVRRAIRYVEENPVKDGKPRQRWSFVTSYVG